MKPIVSKSILIIIYKGKAYLPTLKQRPERYGGFYEVEPIYVAEVDSQELLPIMNQLLAQGHEIVPLTQDDLAPVYQTHSVS